MPQLLSDKAVFMCPHGGQVQINPSNNNIVLANNRPILVEGDTAAINGCIANPQAHGVPPCISVTFQSLGITKLRINGLKPIRSNDLHLVNENGLPLTFVNDTNTTQYKDETC